MAARDVSNFKFFKKAIEQRYRFRNEPNNPNFKSFRGIPYEPSVNPNSIFGRIYGTFRELIRDKHLVLNQYLNISDASVLEKLYLNLKRDPNLKFLDVPDSALSDPGYELSDEYYQNQPKDIADAQLAEQTPAAASASGGGPAGGIPGMPAIPSISLPRMIRDFKIPHAPQTPKPDIAIANKGGVIQEASSGSKLVTADSSGALKGLGGEAPPSKIFLANSRGVVTGIHNIKSPGWLKTFGSNTQIFAGKNLSRIGQGLWNMGKIGTGGLYNLGVRVGNGGLNAVERISMPGGLGGGRGIGKLSKSSNKLALGLIGLLLFMVLIGGLIGGLPGTTPPGEAAPIPIIGGTTLDYTLPLKDPSVQPSDIRDQVKAAFSGAKLEYWDKVVQKSKDAGWNPALVLALWIEETGASHTTLIKNGGSEIPVNGNISLGHLGCAPREDQTIDESLTCLFKFGAKYTNDQFAQFMAAYSGGPTDNPFSNNPDFPTNIKTWYSKLVPSGVGAITPISSVPPPPADGNYQKWLEDFGVKIYDGFVPEVYQWAYQVLASTTTVAPKFKERLGSALVEVKPSCDITHTSGRTIFLRNKIQFCPGATKDGPTSDINYFKQIFIHELGHVINGSYRPGTYGDRIKNAIATEGYLTAYSQNAATADDEICGDGDANTRADEDFAESISYFVNTDIKERDYGCGTNSNQNPIYIQAGGRLLYPAHYQLMIELLK